MILGGAKGGGKGGKGGKGGGKCGIYVEEYTTSANTPTSERSPSYRRPPSASANLLPPPVTVSASPANVPNLPPLTIKNGMPSLMCKIDLSRIAQLPQVSRGQKLRQRVEIADTRPSSRLSSRQHSPVELDEEEHKKRPIKSELLDPKSEDATLYKRKRNPSVSSVSSLGTVSSFDLAKVKVECKDKKRAKRKRADAVHEPRPSSSQVRQYFNFTTCKALALYVVFGARMVEKGLTQLVIS